MDGLAEHKTGPGPGFGAVSLTKKYYDKNGRKCFTGGAGLKQSQAYPPAFGVALRKTMLKNKGVIKARMTSLVASSKTTTNTMTCGDLWADADVDRGVNKPRKWDKRKG